MKRVGLIFGSRSVEHEISVTTASKAYEALRQQSTRRSSCT
jgi:D-alanine-D-alanine ligase-like ATP-grasp enzyme